MFSDAGALWNYSDWTSFSGVAGKGFAVFSMGVAGIDAASNFIPGKAAVKGVVKGAAETIIKAEVKNVAEDMAVGIIKSSADDALEAATKVAAKDIKIVSDSFLISRGVDAHDLKREFLGKNAPISRYDIFKAASGELIIFLKGGKGPGIPTGTFL